MSTKNLVAEHYNDNVSTEHDRLKSAKLEFKLTLHTILSYLSKSPIPLDIADIGGGTGRYAVELAKLGHKVTLIDISQSELDLATQYASASNVALEGIYCADASRLVSMLPTFQHKLGSFDAILLLGPLYHLLRCAERGSTISQCAALLKPNGMLFASFLTKFGHLRGMAVKDPGRLAREPDFYQKYLEDGIYTRREGIVSHHVHPDEIGKLFDDAGSELRLERMIACESFLGAEVAENLNGLGEETWNAWFDVLMRFAEDQCVLGVSEHVLTVARKM